MTAASVSIKACTPSPYKGLLYAHVYYHSRGRPCRMAVDGEVQRKLSETGRVGNGSRKKRLARTTLTGDYIASVP